MEKEAKKMVPHVLGVAIRGIFFLGYSSVNFINLEVAHFSYDRTFWQLFLVTCTLHVRGKSCRNGVRSKNLCVKMLMKLTAGQRFSTAPWFRGF